MPTITKVATAEGTRAPFTNSEDLMKPSPLDLSFKKSVHGYPQLKPPKSNPRQDWGDVWQSLHTSALTESVKERQAKDTQHAVDDSMKALGVAKFHESFFVISQEHPFVLRWTLLIFILVIYTTIATPYMIAIDDGSKKVDGFFIWDRILDLLFLTDLLLQFIISYEDTVSMYEVKDFNLIARNYLKFWFWLDLLSIFPYDFVAFMLEDGALGNLSTLSIIRMFRMFKLFKLMSVKRIFVKLEAHYAINYDCLELAKYLIAVVFVVHLLACGLMIMAKEENWSGGSSWEVEGGYDELGPSHRYAVAAYWATMTLSTIGYGDIGLVTSSERAYAIFAMLMGASIYAYMVGGICGIILNLNKEQEEYKSNLNMLNSFMKSISLPRNVQFKVRDFYARTHAFRKTDQQKNALGMLSPQLQALVGHHMNAAWIETVSIFQNLPGIMVATLSLSLVPQSWSPRELLVQRGEPIKELLILKKGTVMESLMILTVPYYFGKEVILTDPGRAQVSVTAMKYCDTYSLSKTDLSELMERYPVAYKEIKIQALKLAFARTVKKIAKLLKEGRIKKIRHYNASNQALSPRQLTLRSSFSISDARIVRKTTDERLDQIELEMKKMSEMLQKLVDLNSSAITG